MIIIKLIGGLGNQMFQYAVGRKQSLRLGTELKLDHSFLKADPKGTYTQRHYELGVFNTIQTQPTQADLEEVQRSAKRSFLGRFRKKKVAFISERGASYNSQIDTIQNDSYLAGFWQSEKYFKDIREVLLRDFSLVSPIRQEVQLIKDRILSRPAAVSVHFRRGDYVHLDSAAKFHGTSPVEYYQKAMERITTEVSDPSYFFFSDDIDWVKENFHIPGAEYVSGLEGFEDLELMKACRHHIIANSSFSWWGAWLNSKPGKIVISPKQWFKDPTADTQDIIPDEWQKV